ncbi:MAG: ATP-dependent helicase [Actinomycetota bacterium]|jgi:DNA helicase-2/ATP-dependent DNA helicase PcrA
MSALIDALDENQQRVALSLIGPMRVLAGAGSGKTRAITHRIAFGVETGVYAPEKVLALSFTTKAAGEMRSRLSALGVEGVACRTFHSAAMRQLMYFWPDVIGGDFPKVRTGKAALLTQAAEQLKLSTATDVLRSMAAEIEWRKVRLLSPEQYESALANRPLPSALTVDKAMALIERYERLKDERRELDFEDVLVTTLGLLESETWVRERVHEEFRFFVVDEFQDVSPIQRALLDAWRGNRSDICVVGDPNQTIYSFAGASSEHLLRFSDEFPNAITVTLDRNYRSTPEVVHVANSLIPDSPLELVSTSASGPQPLMRSAATDADEARAIAASIHAAIESGTRPENIAILYRINSQSIGLESALGAAGVPFRVRGSRFFEEQAVRETMLILRGTSATNPTMSARDALGMILREHFNWMSKPPSNPVERHSWNVLSAILSLSESLPATATAADLLADLTRRAEADVEPALNAVTLSTIHAAKGLEWDTVYIAGVSEGLLPLSFATDDAAIAEERRLLYVAVTRARRNLTLSWAERGANQSGSRSRSRFIPAALAATDTRTAGESRAGA